MIELFDIISNEYIINHWIIVYNKKIYIWFIIELSIIIKKMKIIYNWNIS